MKFTFLVVFLWALFCNMYTTRLSSLIHIPNLDHNVYADDIGVHLSFVPKKLYAVLNVYRFILTWITGQRYD